MFKHAFAISLGAMLLAAAPASANPEPTAYDTRSVGLGLTGVSYLDRPAAVAINPANLQSTNKFEISLFLNPFFVNQQAPVQGPNTELKSGIGLGPLGSVFLAARIAPRVVFGFGAYLEVAYGSDFSNVVNIDGDPAGNPDDGDPDTNEGQDLKVLFFVGELAPAVSVKVHDKVDLGVALRIPIALQTATLYQNISAALSGPGTGLVNYQPIKNTLKGVGTPSPRIGITYRPTDTFRLGLMYRPFSKIPFNGSTEALNSKFGATAEWRMPHAIQFGASLKLLDKRLMLVLEQRMQFHGAKKQGNRDQTVTTDLELANGDLLSFVLPFEWKNVYSTKIGIEYAFSEMVDLRLGANASISATSDEWAQYFTPPPGLNWYVSSGLGFQWEKFELDLAAAFAWGNKTLSNSLLNQEQEFKGETYRLCSRDQVTRTGCPGKYSVVTYWVSVTLTYKL